MHQQTTYLYHLVETHAQDKQCHQWRLHRTEIIQCGGDNYHAHFEACDLE